MREKYEVTYHPPGCGTSRPASKKIAGKAIELTPAVPRILFLSPADVEQVQGDVHLGLKKVEIPKAKPKPAPPIAEKPKSKAEKSKEKP